MKHTKESTIMEHHALVLFLCFYNRRSILHIICVVIVHRSEDESSLTALCWGVGMLSGGRRCVCISGCVKHSVKSHCVNVGADDPGPVVTVARPFVGRPSAVNLLHSPRTKDCLHLWLLGGGCAAESTMKGAGTSQTSLNSFSGRPCGWHREFWGFLCYQCKVKNHFFLWVAPSFHK